MPLDLSAGTYRRINYIKELTKRLTKQRQYVIEGPSVTRTVIMHTVM